MHGYAGKIGFVDLSRNRVAPEGVGEELIKNYLGGIGFLTRLLYDVVPKNADPYGPENALIFAVGPLNGTLSPSSSRWNVGAKSPATGFVVSGNGGGIWGSELKWAGFDALVVTGRAEKPVYILVQDGHISILPAEGLWGKDTWQTEALLQARHSDPNLRVVAIGQAGENKVPLACVIGEKVHAAGRGGSGAVMGSKNLKAVAVRGHLGVKVADPEGLYKEAQNLIRLLMSENHYWRYRDIGSPKGTTLYAKVGGVTAYNGQRGIFEPFDKIEGDVFLQRYNIGRSACGNCPLPCWQKYLIREGRFRGAWTEAIENSTVQCFGTKIANSDPEAILVAHTLCDRYSLDEISVGVTVAFAMECFQKGIITKKDTEGIELTWGNVDALLQLIERIAFNRGFGRILGQGCKKAAEVFGQGSERFAFQVKGLEISTVDPRAYQGWALGYAVASRGADHMRAYSNWEFGEVPDEICRDAGIPKTVADRFTVEGKGRGIAYSENIRSITDCLEMCKTVARQNLGLPENVVGILRAVTGRSWTKEELLKIGERKVNLERLFNLREGLTPADDTLPWRVLHEPLPDGASKGVVVNLEPMLNEYYAARGW
ncbi:MAG: aldehyde ferredoxin oxidoreductase family protein, partial [Deltaproteobacteria bacterium]|nr:aldehyde ferredoxin oxidoreductase family protein [Deltaproteobacteria bacterium]